MCGIAGFYDSTGAFDRAFLDGMTRCIAHRGPDADGFFVDGPAGLGHRRLSIIDLSAAANQPMHSHDRRYVIAFNGEVYNFRELANEMGLSLNTTSDTEVLCESFARENVKAIDRWNGMFAIGLYDTRERRLYLIRDRIGVKPLYYYLQDNRLIFASELKALVGSSIGAALTLNKAAVRAFLNLGYIPGPHTVYNEIKKLPSGSYGVFDGTTLRIERYWDANEKITAKMASSEPEALDRLQELMRSSVRYRMIADVPYGTFLSGGVDSSLVTALAQEASSTPVKTFSIAFNESLYDESAYARAVANYLGTNHHEFTVTEQDAMAEIETMLDAYDEPYADSSGLPTMLVSKLARSHVTMVLSGDGGDELFMGYGAYRWARRLNDPAVRALRKPIAAALSVMGNRYRRAATLFRYRNDATKARHIFSQEQFFFHDDELDRLLTNAYHDSDVQMNEATATRLRTLSPAEQQSLFDLLYYLRDDLLVKVDIASMQHALEVRTPFLDFRVVEFALNLAENLKMNNGTSKYLVKQLLYRYLPAEMFDRPKWGFAIPLKKWLATDLRFLVDRYLAEDVVTRHGVVSYEETRKLLREYRSGRDYLYNRVWALTILHRWLEKHGS